MKTALEITGILLLVLAALHAGFPRYFRWREVLARVPPVTAEIHRVHTLFIALTVGLMGLLCVTSAEELLTTPLGRKLCAGLFAFWLCRLLIQFFGYSATLWRGKRFETAMHVLFSALWVFLTAVFAIAAFARAGQ